MVNGRAVVLYYGIENPDGSWRLASGRSIVGAGGQVIASPTVADILAQAKAVGQDWRVEVIGFNPYASIDVEEIGVYQVDGIAVDYTVRVSDQDGEFYVWARNLDRALELQDKYGHARGFDLRAYEVDFATLDVVNSTTDSTYRVELLTPGQFHFATSLAGIDFVPAMLTAEYNNQSGILSYSVNDSGSASLSPDHYESGIKAMIGLLDTVIDQYITASRAFALRMGFQGGLKDFSPGLAYDAATDQFHSTTNRELAPMFEAIFQHAPDGANAVV